jgi:N6-adenosine-specific RNA methylase IME4
VTTANRNKAAMTPQDAEEFTQSIGQIAAGAWRQIALAKRLGVPKLLGLETEQWVRERLGGYIKLGVDERREAVAQLASDGMSQREIGEVLGVNQSQVSRDSDANASKTVPDDREIDANASPLDGVSDPVAERRAAKEAERQARRDENAKLVAATPDPLMSGARFATIMLDPPWDWGDEGDQDQFGRARPTYATMPYEEILQLPVPILADKDCHLYLWITNRSLPKGFSLIERWGFRYVTCVTWAKPHFGMGNYFRGQTEHVLFGVKGSQPLKRADVGTLFPAPRGPLGHSSKPAQFYDLVESCSPGPYLEMFARSGRESWIPWGAEAHA